MSWHFLERWVEKANHHSTLVGKFWITFLIVCRIVLIASVGDRVYSDEQSEFKCNIAQPGCSNVCFNKFSPISHLRFWSFQILLVATPTVMFIIYSGHDTKGAAPPAAGKKKKKVARKKAQAGRRRKVKNANANNNNNNNKNKIQSREKRFGKSKDKNAKQRTEHGLQQNLPQQMQSELFVQAQPVMGTMISFQNEFSGNSVEAMVLSGGNNNSHGTNVMWQEMKLDSLLPLRDNNKKSSIDPSTMWLKPKSGENRTEYINNAPGENEQRVNSEQDANLTRMPSCDDNNQNGMKDNGCYMPDDNFQQQNNDSYTVQGFDREHQVALLNSYMPPVYEEHKRTTEPLNDRGPPNHNSFMMLQGLGVERTRIKKPRFTRHFHFYFVTVFLRLLIEIFFLVFQHMLFGFTVPSLYKCAEWPCPNVVDCFISRPMEKTIFLQFMFGYSCICVGLNFFEFLYLTWVYLCGRPKIVARKADDVEMNGKTKTNDQVESESVDSDSVIDEEDEEHARKRPGKGKHHLGDDSSRKKRDRRLASKRYYRDKQMEEATAEFRRHEMDIMMNDDDIIDDIGVNTSAGNDMMQMDFVSNGSAGGVDDFNM